MNLNPLTPEEQRVILRKGTEMPFTGEYENTFEEGTYICRQCGAALYTSTSQIPLRVRLAELRPGDPRGGETHPRRRWDANRDHLRGLRRAPGARLRRRRPHPAQHPPLRQRHLAQVRTRQERGMR